MFGKNYDEEMKLLDIRITLIVEAQNKVNDKIIESIKDIHSLIEGVQKNMFEIAKTEKSQKEAILLLAKKLKN